MPRLERLTRAAENGVVLEIDAEGIRHEVHIRLSDSGSPSFDRSWNASADLADDQDEPDTAEAMAISSMLKKAVDTTEKILTPEMPLDETTAMVCYGMSIDITPKEVRDLLTADDERYQDAMEAKRRAETIERTAEASEIEEIGDEAAAWRRGQF